MFLHFLTGNRYGFNRDELSLLDDARHLSWGYVAYPPITPLFARLSLLLFGTSLPGFRFFSWLVQAVAVVLTGLMARELGGSRRAQIIAALAAVPFCLGGGALMTYISFDYLCWVLAAYFVLRLLKTGDPRWWLAIGAALGFGMLSKYTMGFFTLGIVGAVLLTDARRYLRSKWLWLGVAISILLFLPNLLWQARHHFVSLDFLRFIHERDVREGQTSGFLPDQVELALLAFPLALAGLYYFFFKNGRRFRMLAWMYLIPLALFLIAQGRGYYLAPAYPMLYAAGAVFLDDWLATLQASRGKVLRVAVFSAYSSTSPSPSLSRYPLLPLARLGGASLSRSTAVWLKKLAGPNLPRLSQISATRFPPAIAPAWHPGRELRRSWRPQSVWRTLRPAARHQRRQFILGTRLRRSASRNSDRCRFSRVSGSTLTSHPVN